MKDSSRLRRLLPFSAMVVAAAMLPLAQRLSQGQQRAAAPIPMRRGQHPGPQPRLAPSQVTVSGPQNGGTTTVITDQSVFPVCNPISDCDPWLHPPGTNMLPTIYMNAVDGNGVEMPNTLPSAPTTPSAAAIPFTSPYNLHDGDPKISIINSSGNPTNTQSPQDDLRFAVGDAITANVEALIRGGLNQNEIAQRERAIRTSIQIGLDILEGNVPTENRIPAGRAYAGLPLLHWKAGEKVKVVDPNTHNVDVHQVWYDTHIESDTAYLDVRGVANVPWTITYTVDVLNRGHDDFSPFVMYSDDPSISPPGSMPMPHVAMDQSFFNMEDGTRTVFKIKMAPGKYFSLVYNWGWRAHPPRVQVIENACKTLPFNMPPPGADCNTTPNTMVEWERRVFFNNGKPDKAFALAKLGKHSPEMRMWHALNDSTAALNATPREYQKIADVFRTTRDNTTGQPGVFRQAWNDWRDRTRLPRGLPKDVVDEIYADKDSDLSLVYLNNTIYAHFTDGGRMDFPKWTTRGTWLKVALYNGDYFDHGYQNVDFGGARGWENQFKSTVKLAGSGCWFTFGRVHWWMNIPPTSDALKDNSIRGTVTVPAATKATTHDGADRFGRHKVHILYNYEPSKRLRFYQFDPVHHDVAVFSVH